MKSPHSLSIIIPVYNESANISRLHDEIVAAAGDEIQEFVLVNDGSQDNSLAIIRELQKKDRRVRLIDFTRNFGKEAATTAGLLECTGDAAIVMDADGQHPPRLLPKFIAAWRAGNEVVVGRRVSNDRAGLIKNVGSALYHRLLVVIHAQQTVHGDTDFRLIDRRVIEAFRSLNDHNRVTRSLINWLGFRQTFIDFEADARTDGPAAYSLSKLVRLAIDGLSTTSMRPLLFSSLIGATAFFLGVLLAIFMLIEQFILNDPLHLGFSGTAYLAVFILVMTSFMLMGQGIQGIYLANIYNEARDRPLYVVRELTKPNKK
ncbi:MAG TPA: glycosyltransferase family 2 protein [Candidatus Saccharimonadales bacterium]|nr:glycosyltransferase family 2 protein [Candidatus Saccharimonadales bacterium]